jgi:flagellar basal body-associated protein FliL
MATRQQQLRLSSGQTGKNRMRAVILLLIVAVLVVIAGVASGYLKINQTRPAKVPQVAATGKGVTAKGGQAPAFDVETGSVKVGTKDTTVRVPSLEVQKPGQDQNQAATNSSQ